MQMCSVLQREIDSFIEHRKTRPNTDKQLRLKMPFWCDELTIRWRKYRDKENLFVKCMGPRKKAVLLKEFKEARWYFDTRKRQIERD